MLIDYSTCYTEVLRTRVVALTLRMFVGFFFFKQKTAYEMRISDWSSDVCSSDLLDLVVVGCDVLVGDRPVEPESVTRAGLEIVGAVSKRDPAQIGRASCRERVCQYV